MLFTQYTSDFLRNMNPVFEDAKSCDDRLIADFQIEILTYVLTRFDKIQREWVRKEVERQ